MLFGTYMFYNLLLTSGFTLLNTPLVILYFWCVISCDSYRYCHIYYYKWKKLDDLFTIDILYNTITKINRELFNLNSEKDKDKIQEMDRYKTFILEKIEFLENKYGIKGS